MRINAQHVPIHVQIRAARERRGLSKSELGRLMGVSRQQVYRIELGEQRPTIEMVEAAAVALGCHLRMSIEPGAK